MNNDNIKKLAKYTAFSKKLDPEMVDFVLNKLSRKELIIYCNQSMSF